MRRMKQIAARTSTAVLLATLAVGCTESSAPSQPASSNAYDKPVLMGNFQINSAPVTTNQDGVSKNVIDDYVLPAQLPAVDFELFTIYLYAPVSSDVSTTVGNQRVFVGRTDGTKTGDIYLSGQFVQRVTIGGQEYSAYQLNGIYRAPPTLRKANFANVAFQMNLKYTDSQGKTLADRSISLSVYQRQ